MKTYLAFFHPIPSASKFAALSKIRYGIASRWHCGSVDFDSRGKYCKLKTIIHEPTIDNNAIAAQQPNQFSIIFSCRYSSITELSNSLYTYIYGAPSTIRRCANYVNTATRCGKRKMITSS